LRFGNTLALWKSLPASLFPPGQRPKGGDVSFPLWRLFPAGGRQRKIEGDFNSILIKLDLLLTLACVHAVAVAERSASLEKSLSSIPTVYGETLRVQRVQAGASSPSINLHPTEQSVPCGQRYRTGQLPAPPYPDEPSLIILNFPEDVVKLLNNFIGMVLTHSVVEVFPGPID